MELFEVIRTIKFVENDDRIKGIIADFSHTSIPSVPSYNLGLAQLEEIQDALLELRRVKQERLGRDEWRTVAWTDTFTSQGQYLLASSKYRFVRSITMSLMLLLYSFRRGILPADRRSPSRRSR